MEKRTKIASLFLAMLMAFSLMAVTAAAYDAGHEHDCAVCYEKEIQPRLPARLCPKCWQEMSSDSRTVNGKLEMKFWCTPCGISTGWYEI